MKINRIYRKSTVLGFFLSSIVCTLTPQIGAAAVFCYAIHQQKLHTYDQKQLSPTQVMQFEDLTALGYHPSIAQRFILVRGPYFVQNILTKNIKPMTVMRGVKTELKNYDPKFREGISSRTGRIWVSQVLSTVNGFTEGLLLKLQIPDNLGYQRVYDSDGVTVERMIIDRFSDMTDDRFFILEVYIPNEKRWLTYEEAVEAKIFEPLEARY